MKKFWNIFKKVMLVLSATTIVVLFVFTLMSAGRHQKTLVCSSIQVRIDYESGMNFLTTDEIVSKINFLADGEAVGKALPALDLRAIEKGLLNGPFVAGAKIYIDHARVLHAEIVQKQPLLRVMNNDGVGFYLSDIGDKIPLCPTFTAYVPLAIGDVATYIDSRRDSTVLSQLVSLARYMRQDSLIGALIDHTYVLPDGQLELYPKFKYHKIEFGRADETMKEKFEKLKVFYKEGLAKVGWDKYNIINLKYQGQVVCQKTEEEKPEKASTKKQAEEDKPEKASTKKQAEENKPEKASKKKQAEEDKPEKASKKKPKEDN
jgi:cell division protein FtsQ